MLVNKDLNIMMRAGQVTTHVREENEAGIIFCACIGVAIFLFTVAVLAGG